MFRTLRHAPAFVLIYSVPLVFTYMLPFLGSNSVVINTLTSGLNPFFWMHLLAAMSMVLIGGIRGALLGKEWLLFLPVLALMFDFLPILNCIPFGPSVFHALTLLSGLTAASYAPAKS